MEVLEQAKSQYNEIIDAIETKWYDVTPYYQSVDDYFILTKHIQNLYERAPKDLQILYKVLIDNRYEVPNIACQEELAKRHNIPKVKVINFFKNVKKRQLRKINEKLDSDLNECIEKAITYPLEMSTILDMLSNQTYKPTVEDAPVSSPVLQSSLKNFEESLKEGSIISFALPHDPPSDL